MNEFEEKAKQIGVPVIPPIDERYKNPDADSNPVVAVCGECGAEIRKVMFRACLIQDCPIKPKVSF